MLNESTGGRKTRNRSIWIELKAKVSTLEITNKLKEITENKVQASPLQNKISVDIKNIDSLTSKEELAEDICSELKIGSREGIDVKAIKMTPCGRHTTIVLVPVTYFHKKIFVQK